jgi:tetratricopeptide (TPR) repeat protein
MLCSKYCKNSYPDEDKLRFVDVQVFGKGFLGKLLPERCECLNGSGQSCLLVLLVSLLQGMAGHPFAAVPPRERPLVVAESQDRTGSPNDPAAIFRDGKSAMESGQLTRAEEDFRRVIALDPKSAAAHVNLGVTYMREKRWDDALVELGKAESLSPNEPGIQLNIGLAYYRKSDFDSAIAPFTAALGSASYSLQARYLLGLCYFFTNRYKKASDTLGPLWDRESGNLNYLYVLSIAASKSSNSVLQKQAFDQMLAIGQNTPEFHLYVGKAWLAEGATNKALEEFHAAASARPDLPLVHYFLGRTYLEQHAYAQAETELQRDIVIEPDFPYSYEDLGILYAQLNRPDRAEDYFRRAIERNNLLVNSYFGLAKLYRQKALYQEALEMLDRAEALAPQSASVHYTRGQILAHLSQPTKAHREFDTAARLLKSFNDRLQEDPLGDHSGDAQDAAQQ